MLIEIGNEQILNEIPKLINIKGKPFILTKDKNENPIAYSAICPHFHGVVDEIDSDDWRCPQHGWTFDSKNGKCINSPPAYLTPYPIIKQGNKLFIDLPNIEEKSLYSTTNGEKGPKISLICNAGLLIEWKGKNLLTDPWIEGPSIFGSWIQYPPNEIKVSDLPKIDAIWISHEHSDHLHPNTLRKFDKNIPVYVPKIYDDRLNRMIKNLGFKDVLSMPSFQSFDILDDVEAISFKSGSIWNDSSLFLRTGEFSILNFNDAGLNWNIKNKIDHVDLICSQFSLASSTFPANWTNFDEEFKHKLMDDRNFGMHKMLKQMVDLFHARFLLPIASFSALWHPDHLKYEKMKKRNSLDDVVNDFKDEQVQVLDLLPGESWNGQNGNISRRADREKFSDDTFRYKYLENAFKEKNPHEFIPSKFDINHNELKNYFLSFVNTELAKHIGKMSLCLTLFDPTKTLNALISFNKGEIKYEELENSVDCDLKMSCPGAIAQEIMQNDLSWDEAYYWCTFHRNPNVYNLAFWRMLHAPWRSRTEKVENLFSKPLSNIPIATLLEQGGKQVSEILEQHGMYCSGCPPSIGENLQDGCSIHGVSDEKMNDIISKIQKIIKTKTEKIT
jgi:CMP-N-acetylneuraminate monooxygenase